MPHYFVMLDPANRPIVEWETDIAISMAQIEAGDIVSPEPVLQRIRQTIARLEAKRDNDD